jgi:hypothetical protein
LPTGSAWAAFSGFPVQGADTGSDPAQDILILHQLIEQGFLFQAKLAGHHAKEFNMLFLQPESCPYGLPALQTAGGYVEFRFCCWFVFHRYFLLLLWGCFCLFIDNRRQNYLPPLAKLPAVESG